MKELIKQFLLTFADECEEDEELSDTELMMDDHHCIEWNGIQYYIPENNMLYSEDDELIVEFLSRCYSV